MKYIVPAALGAATAFLGLCIWYVVSGCPVHLVSHLTKAGSVVGIFIGICFFMEELS